MAEKPPPWTTKAWAGVRYHLLAAMTLALMGGIGLAALIPWPFWTGFVLCVLMLLVALIGSWKGIRWLGTGAVILLCFGLGFALGARAQRPAVAPNDIVHFVKAGRVDMIGRIVEPIRRYPDNAVAVVEATRLLLEHDAFMPVQGRLRLALNFPSPTFHHGDTLRFKTRLRAIHAYGDPGVFDSAAYWGRRGVAVSGYVRKPQDITVIQSGSTANPRQLVDRVRSRVRQALAAALPSPQREILGALTIGDRDRIPEKVQQVFRRGGVAHLLAISGMHFGGIFALLYVLATRLMRLSAGLCRRINIFKAATVAALIAALAYAELAGWRISTTRAFLMILILALAMFLGRHRNLLAALAGAAFAILLIWPFSLFEPGFQLSFAATFAVVVVAPRMVSLFVPSSELDRLDPPNRIKRAAQWLFVSSLSTLAAILTTLPIVAYHFGYLAPYSLVANLLMVPLYAGLAVPIALAAVAVLPVSPQAAQALFALAGHAIGAGLAFTQAVAVSPGSMIWLWRPAPLEIIAFYSLLATAFFWRRKTGRLVLTASLLVVIAYPLGSAIERRSRTALRVTVLDVGQGLAQLVEFPGGLTWLIDGGGSSSFRSDIGQRIVGPVLRAKRIRTLDRVVNTHPHPDHFGGLLHVLENFHVKAVTLSGMEWDETDHYQRLKELAGSRLDERGAVGSAHLGQMDVGGVVVQWLHPPPESYDLTHPLSAWSYNDRSIVLKFTQGECSILLAADIEEAGERMMVESGVDLRAQVLVSPHHGSRSSSTPEFMAAVRPNQVVISVGRYNRYGHPSPAVLERYHQMGAQIFQTELNGAVRITCDGILAHVDTFLPEPADR